MYYLKCQIKEISRQYIVVENQGKGYLLNLLNTDSFRQGEDCLFYIFEELRIEPKSHLNSQLFAFLTREECELFKLLLTIKGIGSKTAQKILTNSWGQMNTLAVKENRIRLAGLKGFNLQLADAFINFFKSSKATQQLLLTGSEKNKEDEKTWNEEEIVSSLMEIGYRPPEIEKTLKILRIKGAEFQDLNSAINECLKTISQSNLN